MGGGLRGFWHILSTSARQALVRQPDVPNSDVPASTQSGTLSRLGRYQIEAEIGRGAMGMVYRAHDSESGDIVALKTFVWANNDGDADEAVDARNRFLAEADTARRLHHAGIVALRDAGEDRGLAYMAMAFAPGTSLETYTAPDRLLPPATVLAVGARVADALAHAHRQGVLHRDIKPANVIVDLDSRSVKVTDFGVAGLVDAARTRSGVMLGTPAFMAPEVLTGQRADARSDVYALGVTLFQLLTGRLPHQSTSLAELMRSIVHQDAPDVRSLRPELDEGAARVVARAMHRQPQLRHAQAQALADELRAAARGIPGGSDAFLDSPGSS